MCKYSCDECEYNTGQKFHLITHKQSKHEGIKFSCVECDHHVPTQSNFKRHQESKHESVVYSCNQCNYKAKHRSTLTKKSKHEGILVMNVCIRQEKSHILEHTNSLYMKL